jgi:hypothetical protein
MLRALLLLSFLGAMASARAQAGEIGTAAVEIPETATIPFERRIGERWRLQVECREDRAGVAGIPVAAEAEAEVVSPYGRDLLVDLRWLAVTERARTVPLTPRSAANAALLDERGGGRLLLRVDRQGTAVDLLNAEEARTALSRARATPVTAATWPAERAVLLSAWNTAYRACGVPVPPGRSVVTPLRDAEAREVGRDVRRLDLEIRAGHAAPALALSADTVIGELEGSGDLWRELLTTRFDPDTNRVSGTSDVQRRAAGETTRVHFTFREAPVPVPVAPATPAMPPAPAAPVILATASLAR